jgi:hypothetical protein
MNRVDVYRAIENERLRWGPKRGPADCAHSALDNLIAALGLDVAKYSGHLARSSDPKSSHEGARRIQPTRGTRKAEVLSALQHASPDWVTAESLHTSEVGGSEGLRRLRELRSEGWDIEVKYVGSGTATLYRIVSS